MMSVGFNRHIFKLHLPGVMIPSKKENSEGGDLNPGDASFDILNDIYYCFFMILNTCYLF